MDVDLILNGLEIMLIVLTLRELRLWKKMTQPLREQKNQLSE